MADMDTDTYAGNKRKVSLRLPLELVDQAQERAGKEERTLTSVIHHALRLYLERNGNEPRN